MHGIFEAKDPPARQEIPVYCVGARIGSPIRPVDPKKIAGVVLTNLEDECAIRSFRSGHGEDRPQGADFFIAEIKAGRISPQFPLKRGDSNVQ